MYAHATLMQSSSGEADEGGVACDYVLNYFALGLVRFHVELYVCFLLISSQDLVIDVSTHTLRKILLHTNTPGHYDFAM